MPRPPREARLAPRTRARWPWWPRGTGLHRPRSVPSPANLPDPCGPCDSKRVHRDISRRRSRRPNFSRCLPLGVNAALLGTLVVVCHPLTTPKLKSSERHSESEVIVRPYARRELLASITSRSVNLFHSQGIRWLGSLHDDAFRVFETYIPIAHFSELVSICIV